MEPQTIKIRVRYSETDKMGVVHHSRYFSYFEVARIEYLRNLGVNYASLEKEGIYLAVLEAYCKYKAPAHFDDVLVVETCLTKLTAVQMELTYKIHREGDGQLLVEGSSTLACLDTHFRPHRIPEEVRKTLGVEEIGNL
ncbi:MAG TPA: acyl-CoA thioesterase [Candidatus Tripitaka californicus]|uniref:acyl-CoA thioesterase n=1 Tax=Candidatus Tripitaka californicus TaxID=3367616 RepID=UPI00402800FC|nr:acyl-CoA thioesterase [Planctomycetota bacterium]